MKEIGQISFRDLDSGDSGFALVMRGTFGIALTLSLESDGDIQIVLSNADASALHVLLGSALVPESESTHGIDSN